jgi:hypothetical protein
METYHSNFRITVCSSRTHRNSGDKVDISIPNPSPSRHFHHMQQPVLYFQIAAQLLAMPLPILGASSFGVFACQYGATNAAFSSRSSRTCYIASDGYGSPLPRLHEGDKWEMHNAHHIHWIPAR